MKNCITALLLLCIVGLCAWQTAATGKALYEKNCARCHGKAGDKGSFGAKNLRVSQLSDSSVMQLTLNGKKAMPSYKKKLSPADIDLVVAYAQSLRQQ